MEIVHADQSGLSEDITSAYLLLGRLPDGRLCGLHQLMFHWTIHIDLNWCGYESRYCVDTMEHGIVNMATWDGEGHPTYWHRYVGGSKGKYPDLRRSASGIVYLDGEKDPDEP